MKRKDLTKRDSLVLIELVKLFIERGEPIPSRLIADKLPFNISSATVRNILAELEYEGYLYQPHASSGRIPTDKAYRLYVDYLKKFRLDERERKMLRSLKQMSGTLEEMLSQAAKILSKLTNNVAIVLAPNYNDMVMRQIDFVLIKPKRILVIFVSNTGYILNKIIDIAEDINQEELIKIANYLNNNFKGKTLPQIRESILQLMQIEFFKYDALMRKALYLAKEGFLFYIEEPTIYIEGTSNLLEKLAKEDVNKAFYIMKLLGEKSKILALLNKTLQKEGLHIIIGAESAIKDFSDITFISSTYKVPEDALGCIGVLGPLRMHYNKVIPIVSHMGKTFNRMLSLS